MGRDLELDWYTPTIRDHMRGFMWAIIYKPKKIYDKRKKKKVQKWKQIKN